MKATLEFTLPDEAHEHRIAQRGALYLAALREIAETFRYRRKYVVSGPKALFESDFFAILNELGIGDVIGEEAP